MNGWRTEELTRAALIELPRTPLESVREGRLIKVVHTGTVHNNNQVCYKLDKAGNRINVKSTVGSTPTCP